MYICMYVCMYVIFKGHVTEFLKHLFKRHASNEAEIYANLTNSLYLIIYCIFCDTTCYVTQRVFFKCLVLDLSIVSGKY